MLDDPAKQSLDRIYASLEDICAYLDLEIDTEGTIFRIGIDSPDSSDDFSGEQLEQAFKSLGALRQDQKVICGHNFRYFDYKYLIERVPELAPWSIIDTLELSILVSPMRGSHRLTKDYKQSHYAGNNPLEDARATKCLLRELVVGFKNQPQILQKTYAWLLGCSSSEADRAYRQLFEILNLEVTVAPLLEELPPEAIKDLESNFLRNFWEDAPTKEFDERLCFAGIIAWNYQLNLTQSQQPFSGWLAHKQAFRPLLNSLRPLISQGFSYHAYLQDFGISSFRPFQEEAVQAILNKQYPLILMPTGGGKSLCYQLPALMYATRQRSLTVVISPLQALMEDQVSDLEEMGLNFATFINGSISSPERQLRLEQLRDGRKGLLYISPEQLRSMSIRTLLQERPPALWIIDEAHCISNWGHDFRPDYRYVPKFIKELYEGQALLPALALVTATATLAVQEDIKSLFTEHGLDITTTITAPAARLNLCMEVIPAGENREKLVINKVREYLQLGGCILIYTTTRKKAEQLANFLNESGIPSAFYHGKLAHDQKREILEQFKSGELNVLAATCAFGMGINRKDVRAVIHHSMSANLEAFMQEAGRAGRDGNPAACILLFDPKDADTIFFLQSLNQLSDQDLRNIFVSTRSLRDRILGKDEASDDYFWATPNEIFQESDLDEQFGHESENRDTKIKVALHHLEEFGLIQRVENLSTSIQFKMLFRGISDSQQKFKQYSRSKNLPDYQEEQFNRLIVAMHLAEINFLQGEERITLDRLSDDSGIGVRDLTLRIRELMEAKVCTFDIPLTFLVTKGVRGDAQRNFERICKLEEDLLDAVLEIADGREEVQVNLEGLATRLDPNGTRGIRAAVLLELLDSWAGQKWTQLTRVGRDVVRLRSMNIDEMLMPQRALASALLGVLYKILGNKTGARLRLERNLGGLLSDIHEESESQRWLENELEMILLWLHQRKIIRLTEGLNLFQQALKLSIIRRGNIRTINRRYSELKAHYDGQTRRTHIMLKYGDLNDPVKRQLLVEQYFNLPTTEFDRLYGPISKKPLTQDDYNQIMGPLNSTQRQIVEEESATLAVIAGPGSGKTRTIVHRIAYLVKVKRVDPGRIMVLAFNRNAVRELRIRLQKLVGSQASRLRVFTFHGLSLALLGQTLTRERSRDFDLEDLLPKACALIESGDELDDENSQARRIQLLGNIEHIFVDEYQDVGPDAYRLIRLIAGLGESEDESRPVQINLCVIGDDDQNIYEFQGSSNEYILQFQNEFKANRLLLTENYRSTEPIIAAANYLISRNRIRCKLQPEEQVRINDERRGQGGAPVRALRFNSISEQALWLRSQIQSWFKAGVALKEIAVISRKWNSLNPVRLLLEQIGIPTHALRGESFKLTRHLSTHLLLQTLRNQPDHVLSPQESVRAWFEELFNVLGRVLDEPTVSILLKIGEDLDAERGFGQEELALSISADEIYTAIFEFSESCEMHMSEDSVLVTTSHSSKGLEFRKVAFMIDEFSINSQEAEAERRLFYVSMTRAKEELVLCSTRTSIFANEAQVEIVPVPALAEATNIPQLLVFTDFNPKHVHLSHRETLRTQAIIQSLHENEMLQLRPNSYRNGWDILAPTGKVIGALSRMANNELIQRGIRPDNFVFQPNETMVRAIYHHLKVDDVTGNLIEDWFVVIPQIRVCR